MLDSQRIQDLVNKIFDNFNQIPVTNKLKKRGVFLAFKGNISVDNTIISFTIGFDENFPLSKPLFFIEQYDSLGFIPHVERDGFICYVQDQNLILDFENPEGIVWECYQKVIRTLEDGKTGKNAIDFLIEFEDYWNRLVVDENYFYCNITSSNKIKKIYIGINKSVRIICDTEEDIYKLSKRFGVIKPGRTIPGLYIPISEGLISKPPKYDEFWSFSFIREIINKSIDFKELLELTKNFKKRDEYLIFGIPIHNNQKAVIGIKFRKKNNNSFYPLFNELNENKITPFKIERLDKETIVPRGGGNSSLVDKKILVVGCGALGGHIAVNLAKSGVGNLSLCDPQNLKRENIYRHVLGLNYINKSKVYGLKDFIEKQLPFVNIFPIQKTIENVEINELENFDVIIISTGNPTINLYLNKIIREKKLNIKTVFTWIEPYGIGGHAIFCDTYKRGCYNCLYDNNLYNKASFTHQKQPKAFTKSISGCSGLFVPFSFQDAAKTAGIASNLVLEAIFNRKLEPQILSWKGNPDLFEKEGFKLSQRYLDQDESQLFMNRIKFISEKCFVCGKK